MDAKTVKDFISIIKEDKTTVGPYDTTATVVRVEGSTAWVHIPGGVDETPVAMSVNVQAGDTVRVRVSGGQAWVTGNDTAPPTDDAVANVAKIRAEEANETAVFAIEQAEAASGVANNYLSSDNTGMMVADMAGGSPESPSEATTKNVFIDNDSVDIRDGQTVLASFGANTVIGDAEQSHVVIDKTKLSIYGHDGEYNVAQIGSRNDATTGLATVTEKVMTAYSETISGTDYMGFYAAVTPESIVSCKIGNTTVTANIYDDSFIYSSSFDADTIAEVTYTTEESAAYASFNGAEIEGVRSFASGEDAMASGTNAAAFGNATQASGKNSFSEGYNSVAAGESSHAENLGTASGDYSHAEGSGEASGSASHAEGANTQAKAYASHAQNDGTIASSEAQTAIGRYNVEDSSDQYAFIIGKGTDSSHRANAMSVDWSGNTRTSGTITAGSYSNNNKAFHSITGFIKGDTPNTITSSGGFILDDRNGDSIGRFDGYFWDDGYEGVRVGTAKNDVGNYLRLGIDGNGNRRVLVNGAEVWRDALGFGLLQCIATDTSGSSSSKTLTYTLETGGIYVIVIDKINTTSTNYVGLYIAGIHSSNSNVKAISSATSATVSVSTTTLTVALSATYMKAAIYRLA